MAYPYVQGRSFFPGGEVTRYQTTISCTAATADGLYTVNVPPGEKVVDVVVTGVASVSGLSIKAYSYGNESQTAAKATVLDLLEVGSATSATVITQATSSVSPVSHFRVLPFTSAVGLDGLQLPYGMYITLLVSSVTTTTGDASLNIMASPRT
ncbi:MAG: hypothetical protein AMJ55_00420 [Gammaproteobacteria bacterium SG8_15]|nr:MAG: hypothetical protein AMJ55_00420 [Gammaproteobacteria bacterium SG8_15]